MSTPTLPDLTTPEATADMPGLMERIRAAGGSAPAMFGGAPVRVFVDDTDARTILGDKRFFMNAANIEGGTSTLSRADLLRHVGIEPDLIIYATEGLLDKDGIDHTRLRKLVTRTFNARRVQAMRPNVQTITDQLLSALPRHAEKGSVDLLEHFAYPLPIQVICDLVGVAPEERPAWQKWSQELTSFDLGNPARLSETIRELVDSCRRLVAAHREHAHDDLLADLVSVTDDDGARLSEDELINMLLTLVIAGHETTANLIGNGTHALLTHPDQLALLKTDPELLPAAVHELLRWCGPVFQTRMRYASEDVELTTGTVRRGEAAIAIIFGTNRDPNVHPDPDRLDLTRHQGRPGEAHLAFGHGMHYCLGAALARMEGAVALGSLISTFPDLSLDPGRPPARQPQFVFNRFDDLYVRL